MASSFMPCGCLCSTRTGAKVVAYFNILFGAIAIAFYFNALIGYKRVMELDTKVGVKFDSAKVDGAAITHLRKCVLLSSGALVMHVLLLIGIAKNKKFFVMQWIVFTILSVVMMGYYWLQAIQGINVSMASTACEASVGLLLGFAIQVYCIVVVATFWNELNSKEKRDGGRDDTRALKSDEQSYRLQEA